MTALYGLIRHVRWGVTHWLGRVVRSRKLAGEYGHVEINPEAISSLGGLPFQGLPFPALESLAIVHDWNDDKQTQRATQ